MKFTGNLLKIPAKMRGFSLLNTIPNFIGCAQNRRSIGPPAAYRPLSINGNLNFGGIAEHFVPNDHESYDRFH